MPILVKTTKKIWGGIINNVEVSAAHFAFDDWHGVVSLL
jgi:hypothetical protein